MRLGRFLASLAIMSLAVPSLQEALYAARVEYADMHPAASFQIENKSNLRLWDLAATSTNVYVLMGSATETTLVETGASGADQKHLTLAASARFNSGRLKCDGTGQIYILRRSVKGGSDITIVDHNGTVRNELSTDKQVMEIGIVQGKVFGASTTELFSLQDHKLLELREVQLSYPFSLVPAQNGQIAALELQDGSIRTPSATAAAKPAAIKAPELDERTTGLRQAGAAALWGVASDEKENYYAGLPNFTSSPTGRIVSFDESGTLIRRLRFPLPADRKTGHHYHPFRFAVADRRLFMSALEPAVTIRSFTF